MKRELQVIRWSDREVIKQIDVTGKTERAIEKIERGLLRNMDTDKFGVDDVQVKEEEDSG